MCSVKSSPKYLLQTALLFLFLFLFSPSMVFAAQVQLAWNTSNDPSITGYVVHYGNQSGNYQNIIDAGKNLTRVITDLTDGQVYHFAVVAYSAQSQSGFSNELTCYGINVTPPANGKISPAISPILESGASQTFSITPNTGYRLSDVLVDGVSVGPVTQYTFSHLNASHKIAAVFASTTTTSGTGSAQAYSPTITASATDISGNYSSQASPTALQTLLIADAGPDQTVKSGQLVNLNGTNSRDTVDTIVSYKWTQVEGPKVILSNTVSPVCNFTVPDTLKNVALVFRLEVTTKGNMTAQNDCIVNVVDTDQPPLASAGPDRHAVPYGIVTLNGTGSSDPDDGIASYKWVQTAGPTVVLANAGTSTPSFAAPDCGALGATLSFDLTVSDYHGLKTSDRCLVSVSDASPPPVAIAGPDQAVLASAKVTLDGSKSYDLDKQPVSLRWSQISGVPVTFSDPTAKMPTFTSPSITSDTADLVFVLTVTNSEGLSASDRCVVSVRSGK